VPRRPVRFALALALLVGALAAPASAQRNYKPQSPAAAARKFERVGRFAKKLPQVRAKVRAALRAPTPDLETAVAAIVRIMDTAYVRVGSERYARKDEPSFGASSLRKEHVTVKGDTVRFRFTGKSGVSWDRTVQDPELARVVGVFLKQPGSRLFQVRGPDGSLAPVTERDVRAFLAPWGAKPKDFRTLHANRLLQAELAAVPTPPPGAGREATLLGVIRSVAKKLGHTPAVSRGSYLDPALIRAYLTKGR